MKFEILSFLFFGTGTFFGNFLFKETDKDFSVFKHLLKQGYPLLDTKSSENDDSWLILAQKYRENGIGVTKDWSKQANPNFLSEEIWNTYAKDKKEDSKHDKEIASALKSKCKESLEKEYSEELISKVKKWCKVYVTDVAKELLKFQKSSGDCRLWFVESTNDRTGKFIWEASDSGENEKIFISTFFENIKSEDTSAKQNIEAIKTKCKEKSGKIVELAAVTQNNGKRDWKLHNNWGETEPHRLSK